MGKAERTGLTVAVAGHVLLFGALTLTVGDPPQPPAPPPAVEVEFVDGAELALTAEAPPAAATAPELVPETAEPAQPVPEPIVAPVPEPLPVPPPPTPAPVAQPRPTPLPRAIERPRPQPKAAQRPPTPQPKAAARAAPKAAPKQAAAPASRLGADFLKGIGTDPQPQASGATLTAASLAGIQQVIANRIQPCANRQISPGPGANAIRTSLRLRLKPDGSLAATPAVVSQSGVGDENGRYKDRVADLAVAAVQQCAPLRGLPAALYKTPKGGWSDIRFSYKLPG